VGGEIAVFMGISLYHKSLLDSPSMCISVHYVKIR
jgi:hypothetical protein